MSARPSLAPIVRALGGDLWAGGSRANVPGPGHGPTDRSVSLLLNGGRVVIHCFAGDDWRDVQAELIGLGLVDRAGRLAGVADVEASSLDTLPRMRRIAVARRLWSEARPSVGTVSERHMRLRGLAGAPPEDLRHHPEAPASVYAGEGPRRPAMLAAIRDASGDVQGVEVTYLAPNGWRARMRTPRKTVGTCPAGAAVRLAAAGPRLLVGEGVFTCIAAAQRFGLPAWALLSTRNLRSWRPPAGTRFVLIAGDRGADGERSGRGLAAALREMGVGCDLRFPPAPWADWDEAAAAARAETGGEGRGGMGAADGWSGPPARRSAP